jgi:two-component system sensor histidine kinase DesK
VDALLGWAVREGVTNVLRHSAARSARIRVLREPARVAVEIVDDGAGTRGPALPNGGSGLPGLRERAGLLGGALEAAPATPGGFRLAVWVPLEPAG